MSGKNPYDLRQNCSATGDNLCYDQLDAAVKYLNSTETKLALGVDPDLDYQLTNGTINEAFYKTGQAMHNSASLLPELVNSGVRLMAYAGDTGTCFVHGRNLCLSCAPVDGLCNYQVSLMIHC